MVGALGAAHVAPADQAQVIAEMWLQPARPVALARLLPLGRLLHLRRREVVERHVLAVPGAAESAGAEDAGHGGGRRGVVLVVPLVELGFGLRRDVHGIEEQPTPAPRRPRGARKGLIALQA